MIQPAAPRPPLPTPPQVAADGVQVLLAHGADPEVMDVLGNTALHYACAYGHLKVMRVLVDHGAGVDHANRQGWTPVSYSCTLDAEMFFRKLVADREVLWMQAGAVDNEMAAPVPAFIRSEWVAAAAGAVGVGVVPGRQRASSGS